METLVHQGAHNINGSKLYITNKMKLIAIYILKWKGLPNDQDPIILSGADDISSLFGYFQQRR